MTQTVPDWAQFYELMAEFSPGFPARKYVRHFWGCRRFSLFSRTHDILPVFAAISDRSNFLPSVFFLSGIPRNVAHVDDNNLSTFQRRALRIRRRRTRKHSRVTTVSCSRSYYMCVYGYACPHIFDNGNQIPMRSKKNTCILRPDMFRLPAGPMECSGNGSASLL